MTQRTAGQLLRFCLAGGAGFVIDTAVLYAAVGPLGPYLGRLVSYLAAATVTWRLNRRYTFAGRTSGLSPSAEWVAYLYANALGGGINYLTYLLCLHFSPLVRGHLVLGVAAGSLAGLTFNFSITKWWIFARERQTDP